MRLRFKSDIYDDLIREYEIEHEIEETKKPYHKQEPKKTGFTKKSSMQFTNIENPNGVVNKRQKLMNIIHEKQSSTQNSQFDHDSVVSKEFNGLNFGTGNTLGESS